MREGLQPLGPTEFFSGASSLVTRKIKQINVITAAVFAKLTFQFPAASGATGVVNPADPSSLTFPALYPIAYVASFQLTSGEIQVIYEAGVNQVIS